MRALLMAVLVSVVGILPARAACTVTGMTPNGPTSFIVTPSYSGSTITYNFTLAFLATLSGTGGTCDIGVAIKGTASSPVMSDGSGHTLAYTTYSYYSTPPSTARATGSFANPNTGSLSLIWSTSLTITAGQTAGGGTPNGTYTDTTVSLILFRTSTSNTVVGTMPLTFQATVAYPSQCTIGGSSNGGTQTLDFSSGSTISTSPKIANFATVTCNNSATLTLTSSQGAAKSAAVATASHTNFFDYVASTTINGGTVTLNTAAVPAACGPETATGSIVATTTTAAPLAISVQPTLPVKPLAAGSYSDVLTLTITPN